MGDYGGLYLPMMIVGYIFSVPFFLLTVKTSQKHGQKASLVRYTMLALVMYIGVLVLLLLWKQGVPAFNLSLRSINVYTVLFVLFFGIGYGAYYATADMPIPMVADCSDYETYRSGQYVQWFFLFDYSLFLLLWNILLKSIPSFHSFSLLFSAYNPDSLFLCDEVPSHPSHFRLQLRSYSLFP